MSNVADVAPSLGNTAGGLLRPTKALLAYIDNGLVIDPETLEYVLADPDCLYVAARRCGWLKARIQAAPAHDLRAPSSDQRAYMRAEAIARRIAVNLTAYVMGMPA